MATKRTLDERIAEMKLKKEQAENQLKKLLQAQKTAERKARDHRLIVRGAMMESMIDDAAALTNEQIKSVLVAALNSEAAIDAIIAAQAATEQEPPQDTEPATATGERPAVGPQNTQEAGG